MPDVFNPGLPLITSRFALTRPLIHPAPGTSMSWLIPMSAITAYRGFDGGIIRQRLYFKRVEELCAKVGDGIKG